MHPPGQALALAVLADSPFSISLRSHGVARWRAVRRDRDQRSPAMPHRWRSRVTVRALPRAKRHILLARRAVRRPLRANVGAGYAAARGELGALRRHAQPGAGDSVLGAQRQSRHARPGVAGLCLGISSRDGVPGRSCVHRDGRRHWRCFSRSSREILRQETPAKAASVIRQLIRCTRMTNAVGR